jgi:hypothetical protein
MQLGVVESFRDYRTWRWPCPNERNAWFHDRYLDEFNDKFNDTCSHGYSHKHNAK